MLIEDKPHCKIEYDPETKCVTQTWKGYAKSKEFRESLLATVEVFKNHDATAIISNTRDSRVVDQVDAEWVADEMNPILIQNGMKKIAFVVPQDVLAQWSIDHFFRKAKSQTLEASAFKSIGEAEAWIRE